MVNILKRPEVALADVLGVLCDRDFMKGAVQEVDFNLKYEGYISRNQQLINRFQQFEAKKIPPNFNFRAIKALSAEAIEKLDKIRPVSLGQASRISGVSPADLSVLLIHLERGQYPGADVPRETPSVT
jgi:tRNA uridine 5-carboxymethylaminomethyl modification enzyme